MIDADRILDEFLDENHEEVVQMDIMNRQLLGENYYSLYDYSTVGLIAYSYYNTKDFSKAKSIAEDSIRCLKKEVLPEVQRLQPIITLLILVYEELSMPSKSYHYGLIYLKYGFKDENALTIINNVRGKTVTKYLFLNLLFIFLVPHLLRVWGFPFADTDWFRVVIILFDIIGLSGFIWPKKFVRIYANTIEKLIIRYFVKL